MLALAFFAGLLLDALTVQVIGARVEIALGWSILLYAVLAPLCMDSGLCLSGDAGKCIAC